MGQNSKNLKKNYLSLLWVCVGEELCNKPFQGLFQILCIKISSQNGFCCCSMGACGRCQVHLTLSGCGDPLGATSHATGPKYFSISHSLMSTVKHIDLTPLLWIRISPVRRSHRKLLATARTNLCIKIE